MRTTSATAAACATLLWAGAALAAATPQQNCDNARITAWKTYVSCVGAVVAKDAKVVSFDEFKAFWKCRHAYFKKWTAFQTKASLTGSSCQGNRYADNGDGTVTDNLSTLVWEKKTTDSTVHDNGNVYTWSTGTNKGDGTAFATFLTGAGTGLNVAGFAGARDWRLPTLADLQTLMTDYACTGKGGFAECTCALQCVDQGFASLDPNTFPLFYWSATSYLPDLSNAWSVDFSGGGIFAFGKSGSDFVRAVRGGL